MVKVPIEVLERLIPVLDKFPGLVKDKSMPTGEDLLLLAEAIELSKLIKNNYTEIKP